MKRDSRPASDAGSRMRNQLRIIGGQWRGRRLPFPSIEGLRPTPDRVRETLFNWLAPVIPGAVCLDLFAGSGALGFEASSRGAAGVTLIDNARAVATQLRQNVALLKAEGIDVIQQPAFDWLNTAAPHQYDIVFLDPPFGRDLVMPAIALLEARQLLKADAWVYVETGSDEPPPSAPVHWRLHRNKQAGQVCYCLYQVSAAN